MATYAEYPLCIFELPDHKGEYAVFDKPEDPIGQARVSCRVHLADMIDWRLKDGPTLSITITRAPDELPDLPEPDPEPESRKREPAASASSSSASERK